MNEPAATNSQHRAAPAWRPTPLATALGVVAVALLLWVAHHVFLLIFAATLIAVFLRSVSDWIAERTPLSRGASLASVTVGLLALAAGVLTLIAPRVAEQIEQLRTRLPVIVQQATEGLSQYQWTGWLFEEGKDQLVGAGGAIFGQVLGVFQVTLTGVGYVFLLGLYLAAEAERYREGVIRLLPRDIEGRARSALNAAA